MSNDPLVMPFGAAVAPLQLHPSIVAATLHESARQKALDAFGSQPSLVFKPLELETRLWDLVARLVDSGEYGASVNTSVVIEWLQKNLPEVPEPPNLQSIKWMYTKNRSSKGGPNAVVSELDSDAPLRQALPIAPEDQLADEAFFHYVFELLLCGDKQRAEAVCANTNNWLVRAAVAVQSPTSGLFEDACRQLSNDPKLGKWEAAVYGIISGNLRVVAPLCDSWEKLLLVHLQSGASLQVFELAVQRDHKIMLQHQDWTRRVALAVIQNRVPDMIEQLTREIANGKESGDKEMEMDPATLVTHPHLARILLHLQLVLSVGQGPSPTPLPNFVDPALAQIYIEYLCDDLENLTERLKLVPEYVRFLSPEAQPQVYGHVLAQITDSETQKAQLKLATYYGIDVAPVLEHAVALNFELASTTYVEAELAADSASNDQIAASDSRLVAILHWLVTAELWPLAVSALLRAYIMFYTQDRRHGAVSLSSQISTEFVRTHAMDGVRTKLQDYPDLVSELTHLRQCSQLAEALAALDAWRQLDKSAAGWRSSAAKVVGFAIDSVASALSFGSSSPLVTGSAAHEEIVLIRNKYLPLIIYELFDVLAEAQDVSKGYANVALEFAVRLADDQLKLYELFDANLLTALAKPALSL